LSPPDEALLPPEDALSPPDEALLPPDEALSDCARTIMPWPAAAVCHSSPVIPLTGPSMACVVSSARRLADVSRRPSDATGITRRTILSLFIRFTPLNKSCIALAAHICCGEADSIGMKANRARKNVPLDPDGGRLVVGPKSNTLWLRRQLASRGGGDPFGCQGCLEALTHARRRRASRIPGGTMCGTWSIAHRSQGDTPLTVGKARRSGEKRTIGRASWPAVRLICVKAGRGTAAQCGIIPGTGKSTCQCRSPLSCVRTPGQRDQCPAMS
jgi:hypothetical protein